MSNATEMTQLEQELLGFDLRKEREFFLNDLTARLAAEIDAKRQKSRRRYKVAAAVSLFLLVCMTLSGNQLSSNFFLCLILIAFIAAIRCFLNECMWQDEYAEELLRLCCVGSAIEKTHAKVYLADFLFWNFVDTDFPLHNFMRDNFLFRAVPYERDDLPFDAGLYDYFKEKNNLGRFAWNLPVATFLSPEEAYAILGTFRTLTPGQQERLEELYR